MYVFRELISPFNCRCHTFHKYLLLFWRSYQLISRCVSAVYLVSAMLLLPCCLSLSIMCYNLSFCLSLAIFQEYQGSSVLGQFVTRFMLRETSSQLLSLQRSLQCAMEAVEEQSSPAPLVLQYDTVCIVCYLYRFQDIIYTVLWPQTHPDEGPAPKCVGEMKRILQIVWQVSRLQL